MILVSCYSCRLNSLFVFSESNTIEMIPLPAVMLWRLTQNLHLLLVQRRQKKEKYDALRPILKDVILVQEYRCCLS